MYNRLHCKTQNKLYNSFVKHTVSKHRFEIIHRCTPEELNNLEKYYVDLYQTFNSEFGLNVIDGGLTGCMLGRHHTEETKNKIRNAHLGKKKSEEAKLKMSEYRKQNPLNYWKGKRRSKADIYKMSIAKKGKPLPEKALRLLSEHRAKNGSWNKGKKGVQKAWNKGVPHSDKHKKNLKKAWIARKQKQEKDRP